MCEMFPVQRKPGINLDTLFFVWQLANVMYVTGQRAVSLLHEGGGEVAQRRKRAVLIPRTAVLLWYYDQAVFVFEVRRAVFVFVYLCVCVCV